MPRDRDFESVWDVGLQPERTSLAWQRTTLALLSAGLVVARLVGHHYPPGGVFIAVAATLLAAALGWLGSRRYAVLQRKLRAETPLAQGPVNLLVLASFLIVGLGGLVYATLATR